MKKFLLTLLLAASFYNVLAQKIINDPNAEKRNVTGFHGIEVATGIKLIITEGSTEEVIVSASKAEYRDKIVTSVENGILKIHYEKKLDAVNRKDESKNLKAYVSYISLDQLNVNTGAELEINGILTSTNLDLKANTGGEVKGEIKINKFKVNQNTGSKITLSGTSENLEVEGGTGSKFFGEGLETTNCTASAGTGARININVQKELNAQANTGGNIKYKGSAGIRNIKTNTGGSVSKI